MRFELGSPRRLLALVGLILILFVIASGGSSGLNGWLLLIGVLLLFGPLVRALWIRRKRR